MQNVSPTLECKNKVKRLKELGKPIYNFGLGANPFQQPLEYIKLIEKYSHKKEYTSTEGIEYLKKTLLNQHSSKTYRPDHILVGNGLKELLFVIQMAFQGKIIHVTPSWVSYREHIRILDKLDDLIEIKTCSREMYKINVEELENILNQHRSSPMMMIFNNPNNPTGVAFDKEYIEKLASLLQKYNVIVLADEIYIDIHHNNKIVSISEYIPDQTIIGTSVSKNIGCGGYRLGWMTFPKKLEYLYHRCSSMASSVYSCPNTIVQYATAEYLDQYKDDLRLFLKKQNDILAKNTQMICKLIDNSQKNHSKKIQYVYPNAAWYIMLCFNDYIEDFKSKKIYTSTDLSRYLLDLYGIVTVAGDSFNTDEMSIRLSLVDFDDELDLSNMKKGIRLICEFCHEL